MYETSIRIFHVNDPPMWIDLPKTVLVNSSHLTFDLSPYAFDPDDRLERLDYRLDGPHQGLRVQGSIMTIELRKGSEDHRVNITVEDPHGLSAQGNITLLVHIPGEPEPSLTVADLFPWILITVITATALGVTYAHLDRRRGAGMS
jgi:hypothetical protein